MEVMVAVAAATLLVLAVAALFGSAGDTVSTGRRVSSMTRQASLLERQIRRDLDAVTRDGFMVIRHQVAGEGPNGNHRPWKVRSGPDDPTGRLRRVDEIVFFTKGPATSARSPVVAGFNATGNASRVYYGHGAVADAEAPIALRVPEFDMGLGGSGGVNPQVDLGLLGEPDAPNEFSGGWLLLRHQTVLAPPGATLKDPPPSFPDPFNPGDAELFDSDIQIGFQPAMPSPFRRINAALGAGGPGGGPGVPSLRLGGPYDRGLWLVPQTGIFDVATTTLNEIRAYVTGMHDGPVAAEYRGQPVNPIPPSENVFRRPVDVFQIGPRTYTPSEPFTTLALQPPGPLLANIHAWMRNAIPTHDEIPANANFGVPALNGIRIHAEPAEPDLAWVLNDDNFAGNYARSLEAIDRVNEQRMLGSNVVAPACSEFMVEWSFGLTNINTGELVWYGGNDYRDLDNDGVADEVRFVPYVSNAAGNPATPALGVSRTTGRDVRFTNPGSSHLVHATMVHGQSLFPLNQEHPLVSYFGYHDISYEPADPSHLPAIPWAWPRLLRFTFTLADPNDPAIEQTFQFVYEVKPDR